MKRYRVDQLLPYARNARTHSPEQVRQIADLITVYGWTMPVLIDPVDGGLIAGHGRLLAAELLGIDEVPGATADGWTPEMIRAYRIADNKVASNSGWDDELLTFELGELRSLGIDLGSLGFDLIEVDALLGTANVDLETLAGEHGAHDPQAFWPRVDLRVPDDVKALFDRLMKSGAGEDWERFRRILIAADPA